MLGQPGTDGYLLLYTVRTATLLVVLVYARQQRARALAGDESANPLLPVYQPLLAVFLAAYSFLLLLLVPDVFFCDDDTTEVACRLVSSVRSGLYFGCYVFLLSVFTEPSMTPLAVKRAAQRGAAFAVVVGVYFYTSLRGDVGNSVLFLLVSLVAARCYQAVRTRRPAAVWFCVFVSGFWLCKALKSLSDHYHTYEASTENVLEWVYSVTTAAFIPLLYLTLSWDSAWWRGVRDRLNIPYTQHEQGAVSIDDSQQGFLHRALANNADLLLDWAFLEVSGTQLGRGGYAAVYAGEYRREPVAVKVFMPLEVTDAYVTEMLDEARTTTTLAHPNVAQVIGLVVAPPTCCLLLELCDLGDLRSALDTVEFTAAERLELARQAAAAVAFLHSLNPPLIHRDLKSPNFLLSSSQGEALCLKLCDFGESVSDVGVRGMTTRVGTALWMAPELMEYDDEASYCTAVDVFSLAVVCWEILTGGTPWAGQTSIFDVFKLVQSGQRPPLPSLLGADRPLWVPLVEAMWHPEATQRPSAAFIEGEFSSLASALEVDRRKMARRCISSSSSSSSSSDPLWLSGWDSARPARPAPSAADLENPSSEIALMSAPLLIN